MVRWKQRLRLTNFNIRVWRQSKKQKFYLSHLNKSFVLVDVDNEPDEGEVSIDSVARGEEKTDKRLGETVFSLGTNQSVLVSQYSKKTFAVA